ncbi:MAG: hypothetical protein EOP49_21975, partial [Sphingobacteriales bacterium]
MQMPGRKYPVPEPLPLAGAGSPSSPIELYRHGFKTHVTASSLIYSAAPNTFSSYLDSSKWTLSIPGYPSSYFLSYASPVTSGPSQDSALGFATTPMNVVSSMTLTFQVKPGYRLTLNSFSFYNRSTADPSTGYKNWRMTINGTEVGADTLQRLSVPLLSTGTLAIAGPMSALTGTVTVVLYFSNSIGGTGTVRIDNFVLNGFVQQIPNSGNAPVTSADSKGYRYGFNGKEYDPEVYGEGNEQDYGMRIYDARIGKFLSVDPLIRYFPEYSSYQFAGNKPIAKIDVDGCEEADPDAIAASSAAVLTYQTVSSVRNALTNSLLRFSEGLQDAATMKLLDNMGVKDPQLRGELFNNFHARIVTIEKPVDIDMNGQANYETAREWVLEPIGTPGQEFLKATLDVFTIASVIPSGGNAPMLFAKGSGIVVSAQISKAASLLFNVRRMSTIGRTRVELSGIHSFQDIM